MSELAIRAEGLSKRYRVGERERYLALRDLISRALAAPFRRNGQKRPVDILWALRDVSFEIPQGEVLGLIGRNGAGKSTLLKVLSRITKPTTGWAEVRGRVGSLLEVGTGFHPELTGRENVYLSGAILGMRRAEIARKFDEIVSFAGVERFIDTPLKHFSTGMRMRLAFAVAAHLDTEVLLVDEVLAVGDLEFQKKCLGKMQDVSKTGRTIVFVSHQMSQIRRLCERVMWIDNGSIEKDGATLEVVTSYERAFADRTRDGVGRDARTNADVEFLKWEILHEDDTEAPSNVLLHSGPLRFRVFVYCPQTIRKGAYAIFLFDDADRILWHGYFDIPTLEPGTFEFLHCLPSLPLKPGAYRWKIGIYTGHSWTDPWWALPELIVGTKPHMRASDEFVGILNLCCDMTIRPSQDSHKWNADCRV